MAMEHNTLLSSVIFLLKPQFRMYFQLPRLSTEGYPYPAIPYVFETPVGSCLVWGLYYPVCIGSEKVIEERGIPKGF